MLLKVSFEMVKPLRVFKPVSNSVAIAPRDNTPVERYYLRGVPIDVKREDTCWPFPALAKARGVWAAIENRPAQAFAVVDTARSLNGQLVATIGATLGKKVVCGYPVYKKDPTAIPGPTYALRSFGVELVGVPANRQFVMRAWMSDWLRKRKEHQWFLFPTGLRLPESIAAVEKEAKSTILYALEELPRTIIAPSGTGTHLAGLIRAFADSGATFIATLGYQRDEKRFRSYVERASGVKLGEDRLKVVPTDADYYEVKSGRLPPFPAHLHYECRAWNWLSSPGVVESLETPILFWNVGA